MTVPTLREQLAHRPDYVLVAPSYPRPWSHGGEFIRTRVRAYEAAGLHGLVIDHSRPAGQPADAWRDGGTAALSVTADALPGVVDAVADAGLPLLAHSPVPELQHLFVDRADGRRVACWFHGYEILDHRRVFGTTDMHEAVLIADQRAALNEARFAAARRTFASTEITTVFVSDFERRVTQLDVGVEAANALVIPNLIDGDLYRFRRRHPDEARRILVLRSFANRKYAPDLALRALAQLSTRPGFADLHITVRGFGPLWDKETTVVRGLAGVELQQRYSSPVEMAALHQDHGIMLVPTRYDTQGVVLGEAMASGLATVTNDVAAIGEYTDERTSVMVRPDDPRAFAEAVWDLVTHPQRLPELSEAAAERVRRQCGPAATVDREVELIGRLAA